MLYHYLYFEVALLLFSFAMIELVLILSFPKYTRRLNNGK